MRICRTLWLWLIVAVSGAGTVDSAAGHDAYASAEARQGTVRPNILWITIEDASPDLGSYGDTYARTPNLDRLAREGVRFQNVFATAPVCAPSRSTMITGMYASSLGSLHMRSHAVPPPFVRPFTELLRRAGYYTTNDDKTDYNFSPQPGSVTDAPLGAWDESRSGARWRSRLPGQPFFSVINLNVTHESRLFATDEAFAKEARHLRPGDWHDPLKATLPPYYPDTPEVRRNWARYYDMVTEMDHQVGEILRDLAADGLADSTIVFFFSDHGRGFPRAKRWAYDSGIRVPLIVRWPGQLSPGSVDDRMISLVDMPATVLAVAGVSVPAHFQGRAFLGPDAPAARERVFVHRDRMDAVVPDTIRAVRDRRFKYIRNFRPELPYAQVVQYAEQVPILREWRGAFESGRLVGPQLLFFAPAKPAEELYDTVADPHEIQNLSGERQFRSTLDTLRQALDAWMLETKDVGLVPEAELIERMRPEGVWRQTAAPVVEPAGGVFNATVRVKLSTSTAGGIVVYTTEPGATARWRLYTGELVVTTSSIVRAKAGRLGYKDSDEIQVSFQVTP